MGFIFIMKIGGLMKNEIIKGDFHEGSTIDFTNYFRVLFLFVI